MYVCVCVLVCYKSSEAMGAVEKSRVEASDAGCQQTPTLVIAFLYFLQTTFHSLTCTHADRHVGKIRLNEY